MRVRACGAYRSRLKSESSQLLHDSIFFPLISLAFLPSPLNQSKVVLINFTHPVFTAALCSPPWRQQRVHCVLLWVHITMKYEKAAIKSGRGLHRPQQRDKVVSNRSATLSKGVSKTGWERVNTAAHARRPSVTPITGGSRVLINCGLSCHQRPRQQSPLKMDQMPRLSGRRGGDERNNKRRKKKLLLNLFSVPLTTIFPESHRL